MLWVFYMYGLGTHVQFHLMVDPFTFGLIFSLTGQVSSFVTRRPLHGLNK